MPTQFLIKDETVTDTQTGLVWQQRVLYQPISYAKATSYVKSLDVGGHTDWRLPTLTELRTLVDTTHGNPSIDLYAFPDTPADEWYWTSTITEYDAEAAYVIDFYNGDTYSSDLEYGVLVRAVRNL